MSVYQDFAQPLHSRWRRYLVGHSTIEQGDSTLRLVTTDTSWGDYSDAQLDDYRVIPGYTFPWHPPLRLTIRARFSHEAGELGGTTGFGFWNYPLFFPEKRPPTLPRAIWFFYASKPSDMKLDVDTPGYGWKVATIDAMSPAALAMIPLAPAVIPLSGLRPFYRPIWHPVQHNLRIREQSLQTDMVSWHIYTLEWGEHTSRFLVDGQPVLEHAPAPSGPLCFVIWLDNQFLAVAPWGRFRWGLLAIPGKQWMEIDWMAIEA